MFRKFTFILLFFTSMLSLSQNVSTITDGNFYDSIDRDSQGNIYCSDFFNGTVYKYDSSGNVTTFKTGLINPNGISVNEQDDIFICDAAANIIYRYDTNGTELNAYSNNINNPTGIRNIPGTTNMLVVEYNNNTLKQLAIDGTVTTLFSGSPLNGPSGIAFVNGDIFISNYLNRMIMKFENGMMTMVTQLPATGVNSNFIGFLSSSNSKLYATQLGEHQIYEIDPVSGTAMVYAGSSLGNADGDISVATFNFPNGIFADTANDRIYVSDAGTSNLRIINNALLSTTEVETNSNDLKIVTDKISDSITVKANLISNQKVTIKLFEITGKEMFSNDYSVSSLKFHETINKTNLSSGIYVLLFSQNSRTISKKISF